MWQPENGILCNKMNPTSINTQILKKTQRKLTTVYLKEETEYIQNQINKIRNSVEDRQSWIAWQTVNEVNKRKSTSRAEIKAAGQEEHIHLWKEYFENLFGKPPKVTDIPITKIINN